MFQLPRKTKEIFHGHLTRFKFGKLTDVKEIVGNHKNVHMKI